MLESAIILHWGAVVCYALSACIFIYSSIFKKDNLLKYAIGLAVLGLIPHTAALGMRWLEAGHGPYLRAYETHSSLAWVGIVMFLFVQWRQPSLRIAGIIIIPASFLVIGKGLMASPEIRPMPESFQTFWLLVHIFFAKLAYGSCLIGTALGILQIFKIRKSDGSNSHRRGMIDKLPDVSVLDDLSYRFIGFGFIMIGIMIAAGSIWANKAWGRYWGWDPVETWSLISWFIYGIYLHLRRMHGWKGLRAAAFSVFALAVLLFVLIGIGIVYLSEHSPYVS